MRIPSLHTPSFTTVVGTTAVVLVLGAGTAYAAGQVTGKNIKDNTVTSADIRNKSLTGLDVRDGSLTGADLADGSIDGVHIADGSLDGLDVADGGLTAADLDDGSVRSATILDDAITGDDVADGTLTNQDVGVLFVQVNADGSVAGSSGGATATRLSTSIYEVDFGQNVSECAFAVTLGEAGVGSAAPGQAGVTDRSGNAEAVFVRIADGSGTAADRPFQVLAVC